MLFKQRKPKKFKYPTITDREAREDDKEGIRSKWETLRTEKKGHSSNNKILLYFIIALGMIIVLWYILNDYQI